MYYYYNPEVKFLLIKSADEKANVQYHEHVFGLPVIGERPPYYTNPRYEPYYPVI